MVYFRLIVLFGSVDSTGVGTWVSKLSVRRDTQHPL